jgi:hypothetical protein
MGADPISCHVGDARNRGLLASRAAASGGRAMSEKVPQFFEKPAALQSDWAKYELPVSHKGSEPGTILVECVPGRGNVPRDAAAFGGYGAASFSREFGLVAQLANSALDSLRAMKISEGTIEFGVELGGEMGVPLITKGEARANFKITLTWKDPKAGA